MNNVVSLHQLRGASLEAFQRAGDIVAAAMDDPEILLREVRSLLATARQLEVSPDSADRELAQAVGAVAANKLARAIKAGGIAAFVAALAKP